MGAAIGFLSGVGFTLAGLWSIGWAVDRGQKKRAQAAARSVLPLHFDGVAIKHHTPGRSL